jgi:hypothetical protein
MKTLSKKNAKPASTKVKKSVERSMIHNTSGAEMPDPNARNRPLRKDVRFAFKK